MCILELRHYGVPSILLEHPTLRGILWKRDKPQRKDPHPAPPQLLWLWNKGETFLETGSELELGNQARDRGSRSPIRGRKNASLHHLPGETGQKAQQGATPQARPKLQGRRQETRFEHAARDSLGKIEGKLSHKNGHLNKMKKVLIIVGDASETLKHFIGASNKLNKN